MTVSSSLALCLIGQLSDLNRILGLSSLVFSKQEEVLLVGDVTLNVCVQTSVTNTTSVTHTLTSLLLWYIVVCVLNHIVCHRGKPVSGNSYKIGEPGVEEIRLPGCSGDDDVKGRV